MEKILVLGASGMAGHIIYTYLINNTNHHILGTTNSVDFGNETIKLDIYDNLQIELLLKTIRPTIVINSIGCLINESKTFPEKAIYGNSYFPRVLKKLTNQIDAKLIHLSTDCVFSGKTGGYNEDSFKDATDVYGLSKSLGEINDSINLTIRTSIIGPEIKKSGEGLFHWFMHEKDEVLGFKNNYWSGVTTLELAKYIHWYINNPSTGLVHLTNQQPISKFDLLDIINRTFSRNINITPSFDYYCDKSLTTIRPSNYIVPTYETMISELKDFMLLYDELYDYPEL